MTGGEFERKNTAVFWWTQLPSVSLRVAGLVGGAFCRWMDGVQSSWFAHALCFCHVVAVVTLRAPFVLRTFPPRSGGNPVSPGISLRSLRSASPFAGRKGTVSF